jgi:hypothetical protein
LLKLDHEKDRAIVLFADRLSRHWIRHNRKINKQLLLQWNFQNHTKIYTLVGKSVLIATKWCLYCQFQIAAQCGQSSLLVCWLEGMGLVSHHQDLQGLDNPHLVIRFTGDPRSIIELPIIAHQKCGWAITRWSMSLYTNHS